MNYKKNLTLLLVGVLSLSMLVGCSPEPPVIIDDTVTGGVSASEENAKFQKYKTQTVEYITEDEALKKAETMVVDYQKTLDEQLKKINETVKEDKPHADHEGHVEGDNTADLASNQKMSELSSITYKIKMENNNFNKDEKACGLNAEKQYECLNNPEDSFFLFKVYDVYTYGKDSTEMLSGEYMNKNILVNKVTSDVEMIDSSKFETVGTSFDGSYLKSTGDSTMKIEGSPEGYIFNYEYTVEGAINGLTGLAMKDVIPTVFSFDYSGEKAYFRFDENTLTVETESTLQQLTSLCGTYTKN